MSQNLGVGVLWKDVVLTKTGREKPSPPLCGAFCILDIEASVHSHPQKGNNSKMTQMAN